MIRREAIKSYFLLIFLFACNNKDTIENKEFVLRFKENIERLLVNEEDSVLHIDELTSFEWDSLYIFKPYTPLDNIYNEIGFEWEDLSRTLINESDDFNLLLFIKNKQVVSFVRLPRNYGDFIRIKSNGPFGKTESAFNVKTEFFGEQNWLFLYENTNESSQ